MKIEFENGSIVESVETSSGTRGRGFIYWMDEKDEYNGENDKSQ